MIIFLPNRAVKPTVFAEMAQSEPWRVSVSILLILSFLVRFYQSKIVDCIAAYQFVTVDRFKAFYSL